MKHSSFFRFAGVGVVSTLVDVFLLNLLLHLGVETGVAVAVGFLAGATNGYLMNTHLVFRKQVSHRRYLQYLFTSFIGLLLTEYIVDELATRHGWTTTLEAKLVAVVVVFFWNYSASRFWTFK